MSKNNNLPHKVMLTEKKEIFPEGYSMRDCGGMYKHSHANVVGLSYKQVREGLKDGTIIKID